MDSGYIFEPRLLHKLNKLRKLGIKCVSDSTIKILSALSLVPPALKVLELDFYRDPSGQINLSSYPNIGKLYLNGVVRMPNNSEAFPPNLAWFRADRHVQAMLKKLPNQEY